MSDSIQVILKIISYAGWTATTVLGFLGSWVWNFTTTDPDNPAAKILTPHGRWAIGIFLFSLTCSIASSILSEINTAREKEKSEAEKQLMNGQLELLRGQNEDLKVRLTQVLRKHGIWDLAAGDRVLYDKLTHLQKSIRGRAEERERLSSLMGRPISFDGLALLASFNLNAMSLKRNPYWTEELAGIIAFMEADVVFLQEVPDQKILRSFRKLLPQYDTRWLKLGNLRIPTGLALLYRRATVELVDEPEAIGNQGQFARLPITQRIRLGNMEVQVVNLHLVWGNQRRENPKRSEELKLLLRTISKRYSGKKVILGGVFQWDEKQPEMKVLQEKGFILTSGELPENATESLMSSRPRRYSNFALSDSLLPFYIMGSARYEDLRLIYPHFKREDWRGFVDHNPLLIALSLDPPGS